MEHYQTLGVAKTATPEEIKKAYRKLASIHHPDKGGDTATFQKIQTAYDILSNHEKRQQYDNPNPFGNFGQGAPGGFSFHSTGGGFDDLFSQFFRQSQGHPHHQQHQPQAFRTTMVVDLEQIYSGGEQVLRLQTPTNTHAVKVDIPKGVPDGAQVRIDNVLDGASLIVEFRVHKHLKFDRQGYDLISTQPVSVLDLIAGGSFEFTTISGKTLEVTVKPKTQPYVQLKITGYGLPVYGNPNVFGDQIILLKPFMPDIISEQIINAIQQTKGV